MENKASKKLRLRIKWAPRLAPDKLARLYRGEAAGLLDSALLDDVAAALYLRCLDIIAVDEIHSANRVRCPFCHAGGAEQYIAISKAEDGKKLDRLECEACGNVFSLADYNACRKGEQLNLGGAGDAFRGYVADYRRGVTDSELMLAVDRLIHSFHYSLKSRPDMPTRSVAPNLIALTLSESIAFLDSLSETGAYGEVWKKEIEEHFGWLPSLKNKTK